MQRVRQTDRMSDKEDRRTCWETKRKTYRQTTERQTIRKTKRKTDREEDRQKDRQTNRPRERQTDRQRGRQIDSKRGRQKDSKRDRKEDGHTDRQKHTQTDSYFDGVVSQAADDLFVIILEAVNSFTVLWPALNPLKIVTSTAPVRFNRLKGPKKKKSKWTAGWSESNLMNEWVESHLNVLYNFGIEWMVVWIGRDFVRSVFKQIFLPVDEQWKPSIADIHHI